MGHQEAFEVVWKNYREGSFMISLKGDVDGKSLEELWTEEVYEAAAVGDLKRLKKLIEYSSPDMSHYDAKHCSALHYGVRSGNAELVQYLIERIGLDR